MATYGDDIDADAEYGKIMKQLAELEMCPWSGPPSPSASTVLHERPNAARACKSPTRLAVLNELASAIAKLEDDAAKTFAQKTLVTVAFPALMGANGQFKFGVSVGGGRRKKVVAPKKKASS